MAIYGIGAYHKDAGVDVSKEFISKGLACVGWEEVEAPPLHKMLKHMKVGDLIYIKSQPPAGDLLIKTVGLVLDDNIIDDENLGKGVRIRWVWKGNENMGRIIDRCNNVRNSTLYEEMNPIIQKKITDLLLNNVK